MGSTLTPAAITATSRLSPARMTPATSPTKSNNSSTNFEMTVSEPPSLSKADKDRGNSER